MQEKIKFLSYIFIECMVFNERIFSEKDFKTLLLSQRLGDDYQEFSEDVEDALNAFAESEYSKVYILDEDNHWKPIDTIGQQIDYKISDIIVDLKLHSLIENSLEDFYNVSCDVVNKISDYLDFYLLKETIYD